MTLFPLAREEGLIPRLRADREEKRVTHGNEMVNG